VVLPGWVNNFALSFPRLPQPEIYPSEQEKKKKRSNLMEETAPPSLHHKMDAPYNQKREEKLLTINY
jgi:hypothetical protein